MTYFQASSPRRPGRAKVRSSRPGRRARLTGMIQLTRLGVNSSPGAVYPAPPFEAAGLAPSSP